MIEHAKLTLHLGEDLRPYESTFNGEKVPLTYENRQFKVSEEGLHGFYLIVGHALLNRLRENLDKEPIPMPVQGDDITSAVHEMIRETNFSAPPWLHSIFNGKNPNLEGYLKSKFPKGRKIVLVSQDLDLELRFHESVGVSKKLLEVEEVESFFYKYLPDACKTIDINIDGVRGKGQTSGEAFYINNRGCKNVLSRGDLVSIQIELNYPANMLAFWVNTKKSVLKLHPRNKKFKNGGRPTLEKLESGSRRLKLPALPVGAQGSGTEICIILLKAGVIQEKHKIESRITRFIEDEEFEVSHAVSDQYFRSFKLESKRKEFVPISSDMGLDEVTLNELWQEELVENLHGFGDELAIFTIPNKMNAL